MTTAPLLVSLDEAARLMALSRRTVQGLCYDGELPSIRIGRCRRIAVTDLVDYVERLRGETPDRPAMRRPAVVGGSRASGHQSAV